MTQGQIRFDRPKKQEEFKPPMKNRENNGQGLVDQLVQKLKPEKSEQSEEEKINDLVTKTSRVLLKVSGIFPFDFFPDELAIDENKVSIVNRGIIDERTYSIPIKDLGDVSIEDIIFFASLTIVDNRNKEQPVTLSFLDPNEAKRAYNIIQGLILGQEQRIDWAKIKTDELVKKVEELGQVKL